MAKSSSALRLTGVTIPCGGRKSDTATDRSWTHQTPQGVGLQSVHTIAELRQRQAWPVTKLAYEFLILTALRTGEIRGALWSEIDLERAEGSSPERMKAKADRVPLTPRMLEILAAAKDYAAAGGALVFPVSAATACCQTIHSAS